MLDKYISFNMQSSENKYIIIIRVVMIFRNERVFYSNSKTILFFQSGDKSLKWARSFKIEILQDHSFEKRNLPERVQTIRLVSVTSGITSRILPVSVWFAKPANSSVYCIYNIIIWAAAQKKKKQHQNVICVQRRLWCASAKSNQSLHFVLSG